ncbi:predicted protein [Uncinocarpus reesii 1704]|uniref:Uncharacterized protein n=1 Tax=Uncinocarpus reesii (strain UAMH 1704) TaxID=336963 RepID=C4JUY4_UNCRE|nr:uncharacterized protein UREG_04937 [Uncinocarpus reesii 1704]EEP80095.1 predicted protein [Uncinocarpus reesii 1704]
MSTRTGFSVLVLLLLLGPSQANHLCTSQRGAKDDDFGPCNLAAILSRNYSLQGGIAGPECFNREPEPELGGNHPKSWSSWLDFLNRAMISDIDRHLIISVSYCHRAVQPHDTVLEAGWKNVDRMIDATKHSQLWG